MLKLAIDYARNVLNASKITLGVFTNNDGARYCMKQLDFVLSEKVKYIKWLSENGSV